MERKRIKKLVALLLVGILMPVSLFPFRINADTITNSNVNINYYLESVTEVSTGSYLQTYKVDFIFDQSYLGWISTKMVGSYVSNNTVPTTTSQFTINKSIYVNGSIASTSISFTTPNTISNGALQSLSQSIQNSNVTPLADLSTLDDILNVLTDIQNTLNINVMDDLDQILIDVGLASDYLETLTQLRQYNIPIESIPFVYGTFQYQKPVDLFNYLYNYNYPVFSPKQNEKVFQLNVNQNLQYDLIFISRAYSSTDFNNIYTCSSNEGGTIQFISYQTLNTIFIRYNNMNNYCYLNKAVITTNISSNLSFTANYNNYPFIPIYFNKQNFEYLSTDFALKFGLSNRLLDDLHIIANGTNQSSSASGSLDQTTSQFSDDANDLVTIEESFNNSMNQSLQSVNPTFNMGSSFLTSANWVSQQFNRIVNNTPFASLITFGLTLGLGLLIIGKVRK